MDSENKIHRESIKLESFFKDKFLDNDRYSLLKKENVKASIDTFLHLTDSSSSKWIQNKSNAFILHEVYTRTKNSYLAKSIEDKIKFVNEHILEFTNRKIITLPYIKNRLE